MNKDLINTLHQNISPLNEENLHCCSDDSLIEILAKLMGSAPLSDLHHQQQSGLEDTLEITNYRQTRLVTTAKTRKFNTNQRANKNA